MLEARQQTQTAEHRAQSRVRFDEAMAGIGVQNVHHADADAPTAPRGQGTTAKAKAANYAAAHRATVAAAAQRTAHDADPAQGGQASTARGSAEPAPEATPQRGRRRRASRPPEGAAASSAAAAADSCREPRSIPTHHGTSAQRSRGRTWSGLQSTMSDSRHGSEPW